MVVDFFFLSSPKMNSVIFFCLCAVCFLGGCQASGNLAAVAKCLRETGVSPGNFFFFFFFF